MPWTDRNVENVIGNVLRYGVLGSAAIVIFGGAIFLARHGHEPIPYYVFHGEPAEFRRIPGILKAAASFRGRGIIQLGLLLLIATPIARVAFSSVGFMAEKDRLYAVFAMIVCMVLLYSLVAA
jgi:uncharacterized membrane protein